MAQRANPRPRQALQGMQRSSMSQSFESEETTSTSENRYEQQEQYSEQSHMQQSNGSRMPAYGEYGGGPQLGQQQIPSIGVDQPKGDEFGASDEMDFSQQDEGQQFSHGGDPSEVGLYPYSPQLAILRRGICHWLCCAVSPQWRVVHK